MPATSHPLNQNPSLETTAKSDSRDTMAGKRVLVTGATGLLGRRVSLAFSTHGWGVVGTGFSRADGESVRRVDLRDAAQVEKVLADTR